MRKTIIGLAAIAAIATPLAFATSANAAVTGPYTTDFTGVTIDTTAGATDDTWRMTGAYDATITGDDRPGAADQQRGHVRQLRRPAVQPHARRPGHRDRAGANVHRVLRARAGRSIRRACG